MFKKRTWRNLRDDIGKGITRLLVFMLVSMISLILVTIMVSQDSSDFDTWAGNLSCLFFVSFIMVVSTCLELVILGAFIVVRYGFKQLPAVIFGEENYLSEDEIEYLDSVDKKW